MSLKDKIPTRTEAVELLSGVIRDRKLRLAMLRDKVDVDKLEDVVAWMATDQGSTIVATALTAATMIPPMVPTQIQSSWVKTAAKVLGFVFVLVPNGKKLTIEEVRDAAAQADEKVPLESEADLERDLEEIAAIRARQKAYVPGPGDAGYREPTQTAASQETETWLRKLVRAMFGV